MPEALVMVTQARLWRSEHIAGHVARVRPYLCEASQLVSGASAQK